MASPSRGGNSQSHGTHRVSRVAEEALDIRASDSRPLERGLMYAPARRTPPHAANQVSAPRAWWPLVLCMSAALSSEARSPPHREGLRAVRPRTFHSPVITHGGFRPSLGRRCSTALRSMVGGVQTRSGSRGSPRRRRPTARRPPSVVRRPRPRARVPGQPARAQRRAALRCSLG
jgi:hypothetical protein